MGMDSVHFLNKNLLEILYSPRGGSDDGYQNVMILCIDKGKLHVCMEVESDHQFDGPGLWGEYYLTAKFSGQNKSGCQLSISTNDRYRSKTHPEKNHNRNARFMVKFDPQKKIFYNTYKNVYAFIGSSQKPTIGYYPVIKLGDREYYYIANAWYSASTSNGRVFLESDID
jgi:hypothetical protein